MEVKVLDHGYVKLIESWGSDERIIESARMSTSKGFLGWGGEKYYECKCCYRVEGHQIQQVRDFGWHDNANGDRAKNDGIAYCPRCKDETLVEKKDKPGDEKLLRHLWEHHHTTPFEFAGMTIEVQAPIFVFREWHRHRTQSYNEMSARYTAVPDVNYVPTAERCLLDPRGNKQAAPAFSNDSLSLSDIDCWLKELEGMYEELEQMYQRGLTMGLPKEVARVIMPVGRYSKMRATTDLWNWLHFLGLRVAPDAQWEIRQYANVVAEMVKYRFPRTYDLFVEKKS